jgi:hypothetical protein
MYRPAGTIGTCCPRSHRLGAACCWRCWPGWGHWPDCRRGRCTLATSEKPAITPAAQDVPARSCWCPVMAVRPRLWRCWRKRWRRAGETPRSFSSPAALRATCGAGQRARRGGRCGDGTRRRQQCRRHRSLAGGVVARLWVHEDGGSVARRVVTLGSPHHGTSVAALAREFVPDSCPEACRQLSPDSDLLRELNAADETPRGPLFVSIWTRVDRVVTPPESSRLPVRSTCRCRRSVRLSSRARRPPPRSAGSGDGARRARYGGSSGPAEVPAGTAAAVLILSW